MHFADAAAQSVKKDGTWGGVPLFLSVIGDVVLFFLRTDDLLPVQSIPPLLLDTDESREYTRTTHMHISAKSTWELTKEIREEED